MEASGAYLIAGVVGAIIGALITFLWAFDEKRQSEVPEQAAPVVPEGADRVLSVVPFSAIIVDASDSVVRASAPAVAMGLVSDHQVANTEILDLVRQVRRDGEARDAEIVHVVRRHAPVHIYARVAPLTSQLVVILAEDRTEAHRVEAIRRDFVANVSHELKTPVGAINLLAEAVAEAKDDPDAVLHFAARMTGEAERLTRLVQQIIDLSRLQYDAPSDQAEVISVRDLVKDAREHSLTDAEARQIEIAMSVPADLAVCGDRAQLHAAVSNLVENAVTYSPDSSRVAVTADIDEDMVSITVTDNGVGIPSDDLERIFERFYRVDPARARATGGTGLGLSIVKHVAASNGGSVKVWSEPGAGSSFTLVLPAHIPDPDEEM